MSKSDKFWLIVAGIVLLYGGYLSYKYREGREESTYCGVVTHKSSDEVSIKHGSRTDLYLIVDFGEQGVRSMDVGVKTYLTNNVGDRVCFGLTNFETNKIEHPNTFEELVMLIAGIIALIGGVIVIWLVIELINDLINGEL